MASLLISIARLAIIDNVWVRALLYAHFPDRCDQGWVDRLLDDLAIAHQLPEGSGELIDRLASPRFRDREAIAQGHPRPRTPIG